MDNDLIIIMEDPDFEKLLNHAPPNTSKYWLAMLVKYMRGQQEPPTVNELLTEDANRQHARLKSELELTKSMKALGGWVVKDEYDRAIAERDAARAEVERLRVEVERLTAMRQCMIDAADENKALRAELTALKARKVTLPLLRHIKSRAVSDYTFSEHVEGWDDCVWEMVAWLKHAGIPYDDPQPCTAESIRAAGVEVGE
jgi:hypothetical protein